MLNFAAPPPLSLYVHIPWCVRKCPYCDFNSHAARVAIPEQPYIDALLRDLEQDLPRAWGRTVHSVFIGGGTPSLFSPEAIERLISGLRARLPLDQDIEITLEANPGTVELERFKGFRDAGVNRLSIGIQSFEPEKLQALGRIHGREEALRAADFARAAGFDNFNLDLMFVGATNGGTGVVGHAHRDRVSANASFRLPAHDRAEHAVSRSSARASR